MKGKKGIELGQAFAAVLALVLVAVLVIIAIYLFTTLGTTFAGTSTYLAINETAVMVGPINTTLSNSTLCQASGLTILAVNNVSNPINSGNYTASPTGLANTTNRFTGAWKVTYSGTWGGQACDATSSMTTNFSSYPTLVGLIGTIIFLALVIGVLVSAFAFGGKRGV